MPTSSTQAHGDVTYLTDAPEKQPSQKISKPASPGQRLTSGKKIHVRIQLFETAAALDHRRSLHIRNSDCVGRQRSRQAVHNKPA
jgi:hypothetical protein